jgi:hypothetical protein
MLKQDLDEKSCKSGGAAISGLELNSGPEI